MSETELSPLRVMLHGYLSARGLPMPDGAKVSKVAEEVAELVEACSRDTPGRDEVMHELADVVLAATVVAEHHGFTVEEAIRSKTVLDTGREAAS